MVAAKYSLKAIGVVKKQTTAQALIYCNQKYMEVEKGRTKAAKEKSADKCRDYYRELFDLLWIEFHLWKSGQIPDDVMKSWLYSRYQEFKKDDSIKVNDKPLCTCREVWQKLSREEKYFMPGDPFVPFMDKICHNKIEDAEYTERVKDIDNIMKEYLGKKHGIKK